MLAVAGGFFGYAATDSGIAAQVGFSLVGLFELGVAGRYFHSAYTLPSRGDDVRP